jgi:hypothetical protein
MGGLVMTGIHNTVSLTFEFSSDVPEDAKRTITFGVTRFIEVGLGRLKRTVTCVPWFDKRKSRLDPEDRIIYLFNYEDREDDTLVTVTVEKSDA